MVDTKKHLAFPLIYQLLKLVLVLPVATASVERCFSAMKTVKTMSRNHIGNKFMNDCIICFVEPEFLVTILDSVIINRFQKMENRNRKMLL
jgi:MinD-like ATPase involved in chromosome partitioning or flagellar assembly